METMKHIVLQEMNEENYNRKHIDTKIREAIEGNPEMVAKIEEGTDLVKGYLEGTYYASKMRRSTHQHGCSCTRARHLCWGGLLTTVRAVHLGDGSDGSTVELQ
jgi:hypothetical protein